MCDLNNTVSEQCIVPVATNSATKEKKFFQCLGENPTLGDNQFSRLVENDLSIKTVNYSNSTGGFGKILLQADAELHRKAENDKVKHSAHNMKNY